MDDKILDLKNQLEKSRKTHRNWKKIVTSLAAIVVFCTTYMLILPAITMEKETVCGKEEHVHDENCYVKITTEQKLQLDCTYDSLGVHVHSSECKDESDNVICGYADYIFHEHADMCFDADGRLICELPEVPEHIHTDDCYEVINETINHVHTDDCYEIEAGELICGQKEIEERASEEDLSEENVSEEQVSEEHVHTEACYEQVQTIVCGMEEGDVEETIASDPVLVCDKADIAIHEHTEACMKSVDVPAADIEELTCGQEESVEHTHGERCYGTWTQICEKEEHTHDETCLPEETEEIEETEEETESDQEESVEESAVENDDTVSSEEGLVRPEFLDAWAETTGEAAVDAEVPMMRSFAMRSSESALTYAEGDNEPLDMTDTNWINDVTMYKHEDGTITEIQSGTVVYEGDLIQFKLDYTIEGQQLAVMEVGDSMTVMHDTVVYRIPSSFKTINSDSGNIYNSDDEIVGTFKIEGNTITLTYNKEFIRENAEGKQINGYISFFSVVDKVSEGTNENQNHVFNDSVDVNLNVQESQEVKGDLSVEKAKTSIDGSVIKYMISVSSKEGTNKSVTLSDVMSEGLTYIDDTLVVTKNGSPVNYTVNKVNNSLILTLPEMEAGERYIITYGAKADINLLDSEMKVTNTVTVDSTDSQNNPLTDSTTVTHNFEVLEKVGEPGANGTVDWTITINKSRLDISGWKLTDVLNGVEFKGPVNIYNSANVLIEENVTLPYTFPNGSTDMYYIRYKTEHSLVDGMNITNEARFEKNEIIVNDGYGTSIGTPIDKRGQISNKDALQDEDGTYWVPITWTVTIDTTAGPIPAGKSLVDKLNPSEASTQIGYMTYDQVISAYDSINGTLQKELNTYEDVLSRSDSKVTVYPSGKSYTITQLLSNYDNSQSYKFDEFEFILDKDIPQGKNIAFSYESTGIFYNNTVINSTYANSFSISDSYEVVAKVNFTVGNLQAFKRALNYCDPNENLGDWYWSWAGGETAEFSYEKLKENYLAWAIEIDVPPTYSGTGDVTLYEDLPDGVTVKKIEIAEIAAARLHLNNIELGKTYEVGDGLHGNYTIKVTETGDLEITIPESLVAYHRDVAKNEGRPEWWTFFYIFVQINNNLDWPHINENSMISKKAFENNFTLVNSNGDTIVFGKQTQIVTRDDSEGHVIKGYSTDQNYITYQVLLNPEGRDFDSNANTLDVKDTLVYTSTRDTKLKLVANSVKLYEYTGKDGSGNIVKGAPVDFSYIYNEEYEESTTTHTHTIDLVVPDGKPLVLEYRYRANGSVGQKYELANTCAIEGVGQGNIDDDSRFEMQVKQSTAGADTAGVTLYKVDIANYGIYLPNAEFELFIWNKDQNNYILVTGPKGETKFVTDEDGKIVLDQTTMDPQFIAYNTAYKLVETKSPEGYYLLNDAYYFYIANDDLVKYPSCMPEGFHGKALTGNDNIFLPNEKSTTRLVIRKKWQDYNGHDITINSNQVSQVSFKVYRKTEGVENSVSEVGTYTVTPDKNGYWEEVITNLPKGDRKSDGTVVPYIYYIEEVSVPNYEVVGYEYDDGDPLTKDDANGIASGTITMTNRETEGYELPETGGIGTTPYTMGGLLLMTVAATFLLLYKNKKHGKEDITSS